MDPKYENPNYKIETWEEFQEISNVLYTKRINESIVVQIVQLTDPRKGMRLHSQFLVLAIHDERVGRWIALNLSTIRKIWKFLVKKQFDKSRRLSEIELAIVQRQDAKRREEK